MATRRKFFRGTHKKTSETDSGLQPTNWIHDLICFVVSFQLKHTTCIKSEGLRKVLMSLDFLPSLKSPGLRDKQNVKQISVIASINKPAYLGGFNTTN